MATPVAEWWSYPAGVACGESETGLSLSLKTIEKAAVNLYSQIWQYAAPRGSGFLEP